MLRDQWEAMNGTPPPSLDTPDDAAFAWGRFRRIMKWMTLLSLACGAGAVWLLYAWIGTMPIHMGIASFLGVTLSILLGCALMGLVFLSSGSGHDRQAGSKPTAQEEN